MAGKPIKIAGSCAFFGALAPAGLVIHMMSENNNNGELYDPATGKWDLIYALSVAAVVYVPAFLIIFSLAFGFARLWIGRSDTL